MSGRGTAWADSVDFRTAPPRSPPTWWRLLSTHPCTVPQFLAAALLVDKCCSAGVTALRFMDRPVVYDWWRSAIGLMLATSFCCGGGAGVQRCSRAASRAVRGQYIARLIERLPAYRATEYKTLGGGFSQRHTWSTDLDTLDKFNQKLLQHFRSRLADCSNRDPLKIWMRWQRRAILFSFNLTGDLVHELQ